MPILFLNIWNVYWAHDECTTDHLFCPNKISCYLSFKIDCEEGIYSWIFNVHIVRIFKFFFTSSERWKVLCDDSPTTSKFSDFRIYPILWGLSAIKPQKPDTALLPPTASTTTVHKGLRSVCFPTLPIKHTFSLSWKTSESHFKTGHNHLPPLDQSLPRSGTSRGRKVGTTGDLLELLHEVLQPLQINCYCGFFCADANHFHQRPPTTCDVTAAKWPWGSDCFPPLVVAPWLYRPWCHSQGQSRSPLSPMEGYG